MTENKRALVTGLSGFTGHYVAAELSQAGYQVFGLSDQVHESPRHRRGDLSDMPALRRLLAEIDPHVVIHLAGVAFVGVGDAEAFYRVHVLGTRNLLDAIAAEALNIECVLLASSANIYGNAAGGVLAENALPNPANDYAVSKLAMEYVARLWYEKLPIVVARPFNYTGVGQSDSFLLPKIVGHFQRRASEIELGNIDVFRDFSDVRAVAEAYRRLVEVRPLGRVVNVCSGQVHSLSEVMAMVGGIAGYDIRVKINPVFVRANEVHTLCGNVDLLRSLIGEWRSPALSETLKWMYQATAE